MQSFKEIPKGNTKRILTVLYKQKMGADQLPDSVVAPFVALDMQAAKEGLRLATVSSLTSTRDIVKSSVDKLTTSKPGEPAQHPELRSRLDKLDTEFNKVNETRQQLRSDYQTLLATQLTSIRTFFADLLQSATHTQVSAESKKHLDTLSTLRSHIDMLFKEEQRIKINYTMLHWDVYLKIPEEKRRDITPPERVGGAKTDMNESGPRSMH